jgi:hypothetical protein
MPAGGYQKPTESYAKFALMTATSADELWDRRKLRRHCRQFQRDCIQIGLALSSFPWEHTDCFVQAFALTAP